VKAILLTGLMLLCLLPIARPQTDTVLVRYLVEEGDTMPVMDLDEVNIELPFPSVHSDEVKRLAKLVRMVKRVYPYARLAGIRFGEMKTQIEQASTRQERKKIIDAVEDEIKDKYGAELKKLTFSQGKILIKLIDRETGFSSYDVLKDFKGSFMAFFYQNFARIWGYNLRTKYDPKGEDQDIELIVKMIEKGYL